MKNIVILGAGFGGMKAALELGKRASELGKRGYRIVLIDRNDYHTYTPTLYEISTTSKEIANYIDLKSISTFPIKEVAGKNVEFKKAEVEEIVPEKNLVRFKDGEEMPFEYLVAALGSETNFFGIPGMKEHAYEFKTFNDAVRLREAVWNLVDGAEPSEKADVVIGGAGPTGVELAGELQEWFAEMRKEGRLCKTKVTLIDSSPRILWMFSDGISSRAERRLKKLGVEIITDRKITAVSGEKVEMDDGASAPFDVFIWTGGVKANGITAGMQMKKDERDNIIVGEDMMCLSEESDMKTARNMYGIGDLTCFKNPKTGIKIPAVARAAILEGKIAAENIIKDIRKDKGKKSYRPMDYPYVLPVGGKYAIAKIGPFVISGFIGWMFKGLVELNYLFSILPNAKAARIWLKGLKIFIQNDRLG